MPIITYSGVDYPLPDDDNTSTKVPFYNETIQAILATLYGGASSVWASWTPTWTNLTVGNATIIAKYGRIGKFIFGRLSIILGSTSSVSGAVSFSLPVTRAAYGGTLGNTILGSCRLFDTSAPATRGGAIFTPTTTTALVTVIDTSGTYQSFVDLSSTVPFTWAVGDEITTQFFYEAA